MLNQVTECIGKLITLSLMNLLYIWIYYIYIIFTDQNGRPLEIEYKVNLALLINK